MRWENVSPFAKTIFDEHPVNVRKKSPRQVLMREENAHNAPDAIMRILESRCSNDLCFVHKSSSAWAESFVVLAGDDEAVVVFDRNKAGDIFAPRLERGSTSLLSKITEALFDGSNDVGVLESVMRQAYDYLCSLAGGQMKISVIKTSPYRDDILVECASSSCFAAVYHGADRMISKIEFQSGDIEVFRKASMCVGNQ